MTIERILIAVLLSMSVVACSDIPTPKEELLSAQVAELNALATTKKWLPILKDAQIVDVEHKSGEAVAVATVALESQSTSSEKEQFKLILRYLDGAWEIHDKDLENPKSSTYMLLRRK